MECVFDVDEIDVRQLFLDAAALRWCVAVGEAAAGPHMLMAGELTVARLVQPPHRKIECGASGMWHTRA